MKWTSSSFSNRGPDRIFSTPPVEFRMRYCNNIGKACGIVNFTRFVTQMRPHDHTVMLPMSGAIRNMRTNLFVAAVFCQQAGCTHSIKN
jgi:hypothetical protein